jgi:type I restriction enzyme M protein
MKYINEIADEQNIKLTAKRKKQLRDHLTIIDEKAKPVLNAKGDPEADKNLKNTEQIPISYQGGVKKFFKDEIKPYITDSWVDENSVMIGYEISFVKYFYKPLKIRKPQDIIHDIKQIEEKTDGLLDSIVKGV